MPLSKQLQDFDRIDILVNDVGVSGPTDFINIFTPSKSFNLSSI